MNRKIIGIYTCLLVLSITLFTPFPSAEQQVSPDNPWNMFGLIGNLEFSGITESKSLIYFDESAENNSIGIGAKFRFGSGEITDHKTGDHYEGKFAINMLIFKGDMSLEEPTYFKGIAILYQAGGT